MNNIKIKQLIFFGITLLFAGCSKEISPIIKNGDIYVTVYAATGYGTTPLPGANVFTVPPSKQGITDKFGTILLRDIEPETYEIYAQHSEIGSGKTILKVRPDSLNRADILIIHGAVIGFIPSIELILPSLPANFRDKERVVFTFKINDEDTSPSDIDVVITSDIDGKLYESHPDALNNISFETTSLSAGNHQITVTATDKEGFSSSKVFEVSTLSPGEIILETAAAVNGKVQIKWIKYALTDFMRYEVYRAADADETGQLIASFNSVDSISCFDKNPPLATQVFYYVRVLNIHDKYRNSNRLKVLEPGGKIYYYNVTDAVHHPTEPIVYIVDNAAYKLRALNYETNVEVSGTTLQGNVGKIDIGDNGFGLELYVPSSNGFIYVYDASTLDLVTSISAGLPVKAVVTNGHGYIAASLSPSPWWEQPVRTYSRSTGMNLSGNSGSGVFEGNMLRFIPNTDNIISITTSVSPVDMEYFELNSSGSILLHADDSYHGDYPLDPYIFRISGNGEYLVTDRTGAVYSASRTMIYKGVIERGALYFSDFVFSPDCSIIYAGTSNRNSIQIVRYPELIRVNEFLTKGYPKFMFMKNSTIITISIINSFSGNFTIEKIKVE